jgi:hypothetical protein
MVAAKMPSVIAPSDVLGLVAYAGDAKTLLAWDLAEDRRENLAGFTVRCHPPGVDPFYLLNSLQFEHPDQHAQVKGEQASSTVNAPLHAFRWLHVPSASHDGHPTIMGAYTYTVTPRYFDGDGHLLALDEALSTTVPVDVQPFVKGSLRIAFTRGFVQSQAYVRRFGPRSKVVPPTPHDLLFKTSDVAGQDPDGKDYTYAQEYDWLGFTARRTIFELLKEVTDSDVARLDVFAYDLDEPDLMSTLLDLAALGRVRVILDKAALHHDAAGSTSEDQFEKLFNQKAKGDAKILRGDFSRYAHDKVFVLRPDGKTATKVLTGSTNFSVTGLYVNSNHVLVFDDEATAAEYGAVFDQVLEQKAKTAAFVASPFSTARFSPDGAVPPRTITFSPHSEAVATKVLDVIVQRVKAEGAKHAATASVLFAVMGLSGGGEVYPVLKALHERDDLFTGGVSDDRGAISLYKTGSTRGTLVTGLPGTSVLPEPFSQVPTVAGHQIHHKFVVCGFNGDDPTVFCGSSNLALLGEQKNGDNLIAIHDGDVATAFAIEAIALVGHFGFLDRYQEKKKAKGVVAPKPPANQRAAAKDAGWFLSTTDGWSRSYFDTDDLHCVDRTLFAAPLTRAPDG